MEKGQCAHPFHEESVRLAGSQVKGTATQTASPEAALEPSKPRQEPLSTASWGRSISAWLSLLDRGCGWGERFHTRGADLPYRFHGICGVHRFGRMSSLISRTLELSLLGHQAWRCRLQISFSEMLGDVF